jgi:hypothetical protein
MIEPGQKIAVSDTLKATVRVLNEDRMRVVEHAAKSVLTAVEVGTECRPFMGHA